MSHPLVTQFTGVSVGELEEDFDRPYLDSVESWLASLGPAVFTGLVRFAVECNGDCVGLTPEVESLAVAEEVDGYESYPALYAHYGIAFAVVSPEWEDLEIDELLTSTRGYFFGDSGG